ncbi:protein of unknown function [Hymenobacter gelipurpurascens]|uniref:DUF4350 domain-containing protein n=1 Tax=Hymenobacter gelipurpurascens TaxID=89968 RepID=A0A212U982_9BACT|nr:DUF4350 domain-containing protein [Hymenobacter gelipurpurascens]SNC74776.1 protein of unknown function [Hymenobacter gelipurpurascens]
MTRFRAFLLGLVALFTAFVLVEYFRPTPTNWRQTYINHDKIPYGTYVLYDALASLFPGQTVSMVRQPIANQLLPTLDTDINPDSALSARGLPPLLRQQASYVFINQEFSCSRLDRDALLRYVAQGNTAFIAAEQFDNFLQDTLHFDTAPDLTLDSLMSRQALRYRNNQGPASQTATLKLLTPLRSSATQQFRFSTDDVRWHFVAYTGCPATVLATDARKQPVLLRVAYGKGNLLLSSTPAVFSNIVLLQPSTATYAFAAMSLLPANRAVFWDEYQKQGALGEQSLLRVLKQNIALRWALYTSLAGLALFAFFEARRRQRIIPILKPLPNTTLLFTRTVASLYRQGSNHAPIAEKKIGLFREQLRYRLQEPELDLNDDATRERLAQKAGIPRPQVDELIKLIHRIETAPQVTAHDLLRLSRALSNFKKAAF